MKCDVCSKAATVFLTQIINGQMTTVNLCDHCSKEKGVTDTMGFGLAEAFVSPITTNVLPRAGKGELVCPACSFTQSQLKKIGRMGCPECYSTFRDGLDNLLTAMHKGTHHIGKTPDAKPISESQIERSIELLKEKIQAAVADERYEDAARCKAEIDALTKRLAERAAVK